MTDLAVKIKPTNRCAILSEAKSEPSVPTEVQKVDAAVDKAGTGRYRRDIHLAATAEETLRAHLAKPEQAKPIGTDRDDEQEERFPS